MAGKEGLEVGRRTLLESEGTQMKRVFLATLVFIVLAFFVLAFTHPFWQLVQGDYLSPQHWLRVYLGMTLIVTVVALVFTFLARLSFPSKGILASITVAILTGSVLAAYSQWVGVKLTAQDAERLLLRDFNHFFRDFRSIAFTFLTAPLLGVAAGLLHAYLNRSHRKGRVAHL
jgi:hypothetical protein